MLRAPSNQIQNLSRCLHLKETHFHCFLRRHSLMAFSNRRTQLLLETRDRIFIFIYIYCVAHLRRAHMSINAGLFDHVAKVRRMT